MAVASFDNMVLFITESSQNRSPRQVLKSYFISLRQVYYHRAPLGAGGSKTKVLLSLWSLSLFLAKCCTARKQWPEQAPSLQLRYILNLLFAPGSIVRDIFVRLLLFFFCFCFGRRFFFWLRYFVYSYSRGIFGLWQEDEQHHCLPLSVL